MTTKKKVLSGLFALALLTTTAVGITESKKSETTMSDLAMANVEALANGENSTGVECRGSGRTICPLNGQPYYSVKIWG